MNCWICKDKLTFNDNMIIFILMNRKSIDNVTGICSAKCLEQLETNFAECCKSTCHICNKKVKEFTVSRLKSNLHKTIIFEFIQCNECAKNNNTDFDENEIFKLLEKDNSFVYKKCIYCQNSEKFQKEGWEKILFKLSTENKEFVSPDNVYACNYDCVTESMMIISKRPDSCCFVCNNRLSEATLIPYHTADKKTNTKSTIMHCSYKCYKTDGKKLRKSGEYAYICDYCHKISFENMNCCGKCKMSYYCNTNCQKNDWKNGSHKICCNIAQKLQ